MRCRELLVSFRRFLPFSAKADSRSRGKNHVRRGLRFEAFERRELMAADIGYSVGEHRFVVPATSGPDQVEFIAGTAEHTLRVNGVEQRLSASQYTDIRFENGSKDDSIRLVDIASTDEVFKAWNDKVELTNASLFVRATGFGNVQADAVGGANDKAYLYGTDAMDCIESSPTESSILRNGGIVSRARGFDRIYVYAHGGEDRAKLRDGDGDDSIVIKETVATLQAPESYTRLLDVEVIQAFASSGGYDKAYLYDTGESDLLVITEERVRMVSSTRDNTAIGFERNYSYSSNGQSDYVRVYDSVFDAEFSYDTLMADTSKKNGFEASENFMRLFSGTFYNRAEGFVVSDVMEVNPRYLIGEVSEAGAVDVNAEWELGLRDNYFIELQRYGAELIMAGLGIANDAMANKGIEVVQWGLDQQSDDGSFEYSGDAVHSTSLFLHAVGLSIEELDRFEYAAFDASLRMRWLDGLDRMATWMINHDDVSREVDLEPFSHRFFLRATGLKRAAMLTGNAALGVEADRYLADGVARMTADGVLSERGGFDLNYQTLGLKYAGEFFRITNDAQQHESIRSLFVASLSWIAARIDADGNVDLSDSSRASEEARNGSVKTFDYTNAVRAYFSGYEITGDATWLTLANAVFQHDKSLD